MFSTPKTWGAQLLFALVPLASSAIQINNFTELVNDRFADSDNFIANAYDLSGIGRSADKSQGRWGTLVSSNVFISANHFHPDAGNSMTFYATNDPNGASATRTVQSGQRIGDSDVWVGILSDPVPSGYATYTFASDPISSSLDFLLSDYNDADAYLFGRSPTAYATELLNVAVGRNRISDWVPNVTVGSTTDNALLARKDESGDSGYVPYESYLQGGDSGGPLFVDTGSEFVFVSSNWFIATLDEPSAGLVGDYNGFTYLGNYADDIQAIIDANPVPEARHYALAVGLVLGGLLTLRNRRLKC